MSRTKATAAALAALALVLAGCGSGREAQTTESDSRVDGVNVDLPNLLIRNAHVAPPESGDLYEAGANAPLEFIVYNETAEADRLVSAASPDAASVEVTPSPAVVAPRAELVAGRTASGYSVTGTGGTVSVVLTGLNRKVRPGSIVRVVLVFERAGEVAMQAPVALPPTKVGGAPSPTPAAEAEGGTGH